MVIHPENEAARQALAERARARAVVAGGPLDVRPRGDEPSSGRAPVHHRQLLSAAAMHEHRRNGVPKGGEGLVGWLVDRYDRWLTVTRCSKGGGWERRRVAQSLFWLLLRSTLASNMI